MMPRFARVLMSAAAVLLFVPSVGFAGGVGCCQLGEECVEGGGALFMTCVLSQGEFTPGGVCSSTPIGVCGLPPDDMGCCQLGEECVEGGDALFMTCALSQGVFTAGGVCSAMPIGACGPPPPATATATATSTPTPAADGAACSTPSQCISGFCADGFCCNEACDSSTERCDLSGREGLCLSSAPAPAASGWALTAMAAALIAIAGLALRQLRR